MNQTYIEMSHLPDFSLWEKMSAKGRIVYFDLELTARCNNDCRHCYINLPAGDPDARRKELTLEEICDIADQAVAMGAIWCLISGGEPLLRRDFAEIYMALKRKGLLVSVYTNACLIRDEHIDLFRRYPPRDIEITVYGITRETYEKITRKPGSYDAFRRGLQMLLDAGFKVRLKTVALRSNIHELADIAAFCRKHTKDYYRYDPMMHLRYDMDPARNAEIREERLSPGEIAALEQADLERSGVLKRKCDDLLIPAGPGSASAPLFLCGAGKGIFSVSYDGLFRPCLSLWHPDCVYDLRKGRLADAFGTLVPRIYAMRTSDPEYVGKCRSCAIVNLCICCPAHAYLERGRMDAWCDYFCAAAHARLEGIKKANGDHDLAH